MCNFTHLCEATATPIDLNFFTNLSITFGFGLTLYHTDYLSLCFNGHFPGEPGLAGVY